MTAFTRRALDFFLDHGIVAERLMTDNAYAYIHNRSLRELLHQRAIRHIRTRRSRRVGWEYCHSIIDDCSRLAYSEIHDDERAATVTAFTRRALDWFLEHGIVAERLMTDNAFAYVHNRSLRTLLHDRLIEHLRTRPYTPRTNGKVERYQQTLQREWAYALRYASSQARRASLPHWVRHYNERRTHSALGNRPPINHVREVTGLDS